MDIRLEHANICVHDIDRMIKFLRTAFPEFKIRYDGIGSDGVRWVHVGTETTYIALEQVSIQPENKWIPYSGKPGVNHLAYEVENGFILMTLKEIIGNLFNIILIKIMSGMIIHNEREYEFIKEINSTS